MYVPPQALIVLFKKELVSTSPQSSVADTVASHTAKVGISSLHSTTTSKGTVSSGAVVSSTITLAVVMLVFPQLSVSWKV